MNGLTGPPYENVRLSGKFERFDPADPKTGAYIRVGDDLLHASIISRGVLEENGAISPCINGSRHDPIDPGAKVFVDVNFNSQGQSPMIAAWAPKIRCKAKPQE